MQVKHAKSSETLNLLVVSLRQGSSKVKGLYRTIGKLLSFTIQHMLKMEEIFWVPSIPRC